MCRSISRPFSDARSFPSPSFCSWAPAPSVGEAIDIYVNNRLVARGEVVVVDERLGVTMTEIIKDGNTAA